MNLEFNPLTPTEFTQPGPIVPTIPTFLPAHTATGLAVGMRQAPAIKLVPPKQHYVVGFLFFGKDVVLIEKRTGPTWMKGLLNGVGGKVEPGEASLDAMIREFREEANLGIRTWGQFATLGGPDWTMDCFWALERDFSRKYVKALTEEPVGFYAVNDVVFDPELKVVPNLRWMIPMALQSETDPYGPYNVSVGESHLTGTKFAGSPTATSLPQLRAA